MKAELLALDSSARVLSAGDLRAVFLPGRGMLGASLEHRGEELLGGVEHISAYARDGHTCGIPLLHPWANRLATHRYRSVEKDVLLDGVTSIGYDENGLPMHGVPWPWLAWRVIDEDDVTLKARLDWTSDELLAVFPFPHHVEMNVALSPDTLSVETTLLADESSTVPASFGFHPYFRLPGLPRADWHIVLPEMSQLLLDEWHIPTGEEEPFSAIDFELGDRELDDGFKLAGDGDVVFSLKGGGRRIEIEFAAGYPYAQVYAPLDHDYIAIEPMTAPANALVSGRGLRLIEPGGSLRATFHVIIH
jgi:galactose mutarotase-like enzyme